MLVCDPERVRTRAHDLVATSEEFLEASWHNAAAGNVTPIDLRAAAYRSVGDVRGAALARGIPWWAVSPFGGDVSGDDVDAATLDPDAIDRLTVDVRAAESYRGETARAFAQAGEWLRDGWSVVLVTAGHGTAERVAESARGEGLAVRLVDGLDVAPDPGVVTVVTGGLEHGFVAPSLRLAVLTETDLVGQRSTTRDTRRMPTRRRQTIDPLQLKAGDYVVHEQHGVGRYVEMVQRTVAGATREYLVVEYAPAKRGQPGDRLYVPTDQLDQVTRYVGGEAPSLHRLGGADWTKTKARARKAVRQIAGELIRLYAARMASRGHAFGADTVWQRELEDAFPYNETPDQLSCIDEVKADMENVVPMDRLICGDVGYGKTEIAVRAAFKAVQDGKQVAILVPTTLLVQQHMSTFSERYAAFPVRVAALSRFQTDKEAKAVIEGITAGTIDVVIGTHRLFSTEVRFKDLGLVIVDEEQRFGVEHKEHLKAMRMDVDFLTMSATPIPRTLEMAVTGIREMSTIQTPPEERHPVLTFVGPYDDKQVAAAIRRELLRDGQVFFVHNRVESIDRVAAKLRELVPEARVADGARPDERAHPRAGHRRLLGEGVRRPRLDHDRRERPRHPEREHPHPRPRRHVRPLAAAPAARPGRSRPRAGLRLLPLPAGEAAHRDGARPARHHRGEHRPRLRHGRGDEGPRDPRRGQPARRRAERAHRRRRLRPLRAARRRGRRGVPPRRCRTSRSSPTSRSRSRSTRTSRTSTSRRSGCASRPTSGSRPPRPRRTWTAWWRSSSTATDSSPRRCSTCSPWRGSGSTRGGPA